MTDFTRPLFRGHVVAWLVMLGLCSAVASIYFAVTKQYVNEAQVHAPSRTSALGYGAFAAWLARVDIPVSDLEAAKEAGREVLLVVPEERARYGRPLAGPDVDAATNVLVVLPKWEAIGRAQKNGFLSKVRHVPKDEVRAVLLSLLPEAGLDEVQGIPDSSEPRLDLVQPQTFTNFDAVPEITAGKSLLAGSVPRAGGRFCVLSDPDLIANHGIGRGKNALVALELIRHLLPPDGVVVFAEREVNRPTNIHSPAGLLFTFPFVLLPIVSAALTVVLCWGALGRFGGANGSVAPRPSGKGALVGSAVKLISTPEQRLAFTRRYSELCLRLVASALHAPPQLTKESMLDWLRQRRRGSRAAQGWRTLDEALNEDAQRGRADPVFLAKVALNFYRWKQETIDGSE